MDIVKAPMLVEEPPAPAPEAPDARRYEEELPAPEEPQPKKKRRGLRIALIVLGAAVIFLSGFLFVITRNFREEVRSYSCDNPYVTPYGTTLVSAHRSGGGIFPENTMMAFEGCIESETFRTDIFEFDLHITKDGELILLHDNTLDRTTNSRDVFGISGARPENYTLSELRELNFGEGFKTDDGQTPYKGLRGDAVPESLRAATLTQVLDYLEANGGFRYIIEIKNKGELGCAAADRLHAVLKEKGLLQKVIVGTFHGGVTRYLDNTYPDMLRSASITEVIGFYLDSLFNVDRPTGYYKFTALQIPANQYVVRLGTSKLTNYAHKNNIAVQYWTINDPEDMAWLKEINADCVMSDEPDIAYIVLYSIQ